MSTKLMSYVAFVRKHTILSEAGEQATLNRLALHMVLELAEWRSNFQPSELGDLLFCATAVADLSGCIHNEHVHTSYENCLEDEALEFAHHEIKHSTLAIGELIEQCDRKRRTENLALGNQYMRLLDAIETLYGVDYIIGLNQGKLCERTGWKL